MDAETYLRCRLEDAVLAGRRTQSEYTARVRAALAVGSVEEPVAEVLLRDAARVLRLREQHDRYDNSGDAAAQKPRVIAAPTSIEQSWGRMVVTHLVIGPHHTTLGVRGELNEPRPRGRHGHPGDEPWEDVEIVDTAGTRYHANFSGSNSDTSFDGELHIHPTLDPACGPLTVGGRTIDLTATPPYRAMRVEALSGLSPAERATRHLELWRDSRRHADHDEQAIVEQTFADLGVTAVETGPGPAPQAHRAHRGRRTVSAGGPDRFIAVGATTPEVDGVVTTLTVLSEDGVLGYVGSTRGISGDTAGMIRVRATDDRGGVYSAEGHDNGWGGGQFHGSARLRPDLDPAARVLTIVLDTLCHRVHVDVPLDWVQLR